MKEGKAFREAVVELWGWRCFFGRTRASTYKFLFIVHLLRYFELCLKTFAWFGGGQAVQTIVATLKDFFTWSLLRIWKQGDSKRFSAL